MTDTLGTSNLNNKLIAVLGYGQEGEAVTKYLLKHRLEPVLFDHKPWKVWPKQKQEEIKALKLNFIFGPDAFKELAGFSAAFRSPGVPLTHPDLTKWKKLVLTSQTKFFFDHCPAKIIGVTGTKGKGTTCALIYEMLKQAKSYKLKAKSYLTGNIGKEQPLEILDNLKKDDWVVYELSSFQLLDLRRSPHIAVVLMTTSEHLDYHKNKQEYISAKASIAKYQNASDFTIINADYPKSVKIGEQGLGKKIYFSRQKKLQSGFFIEGNQLIVKRIFEADFHFSISNIQLRGRHNLENICAAVATATCLGIKASIIRQTVENFKGLEHRLEMAGEKRGVKFYNDSFSTTPETAIAAIQAFNEPLIVILGGSGKNSDFTALGKTVRESKNIKALILIGEEANRIKHAIGKTKVKILESAKNMKEIFYQIKSVATHGNVVLLSPACASFDMFKNYKDRGEQFKKAIKTF